MSERYSVNEIFDSIQGEGLGMGIPATFIRLQGCNLRCSWCDTKGTWDETVGTIVPMTSAEIMDQIHFEHVILTGGEPLLYDLTPLLLLLMQKGEKVHIETNGTQPWLESYPKGIWVTVSPKRESGYKVHPSLKSVVREYKFVVDEGFDPTVLDSFLISTDNKDSDTEEIPVLLSPENTRSEMVQKAMAILFRYPQCRLTLQVHKLIHIK